jgi:hypothetical protein
MKKANFLTSCVSMRDGQVDELMRLKETWRGITYETFMRRVNIKEVKELPYFDVYDWRDGNPNCCPGLTLKKDWGVSFYSGEWFGKRCYVVCHSAIEYIFVEE